MDWGNCARELGQALSRYNGLTNSPKLGLIAEAAASSLFDGRSFSYAVRIREYFHERAKKSGKENGSGKDMGQRSAEVHISHGICLGLWYRAVPGASFRGEGLKSKLEATSHIALTPLGRTCRAAVAHNMGAFRNFILTFALLESDFDMYGLLIKLAQENDGCAPDKEVFINRFYDICALRQKWMLRHFSSGLQRRRIDIQRHVQWIGRRLGEGKTGKKREFVPDHIFRFDGETPAHHLNQRKKWARETLAHLDDSGKLTELGENLAKRLPGSANEEPFFWLGPSEECASAQIVTAAKIAPDQCAPAWRLLRPRNMQQDQSVKDEMTERTANFMKSSFDNMKLGTFKQSSLDVIVPYVYFLECEYGGRVEEREFFQRLLGRYRDKFVCLMQPKLFQSHFRLR